MELLEGDTLDRRLLGRPLEPKQLLDDRRAGRRRARCRARRRHPAPRHQAGQHLPHAARPREGARLRPRQARRTDVRRETGGDHDHHGRPDDVHERGRHHGRAPSPTCRPSRRAARISTRGPICSRSASCSTRWRPGALSFPGNTTAVIFDGILNRDPAPAWPTTRSITPELDRIIAKALEKDRALRYQTAADLRADLQRLRRDSSSRQSTPAAGRSTPEPPPCVMSPGSRRVAGRGSRRRRLRRRRPTGVGANAAPDRHRRGPAAAQPESSSASGVTPGDAAHPVAGRRGPGSSWSSRGSPVVSAPSWRAGIAPATPPAAEIQRHRAAMPRRAPAPLLPPPTPPAPVTQAARPRRRRRQRPRVNVKPAGRRGPRRGRRRRAGPVRYRGHRSRRPAAHRVASGGAAMPKPKQPSRSGARQDSPTT